MAFEQVTDSQREVIVLFKTENPTWGLSKCKEILPEFFSNISQNQFSYVVSKLKNENVDSRENMEVEAQENLALQFEQLWWNLL